MQTAELVRQSVEATAGDRAVRRHRSRGRILTRRRNREATRVASTSSPTTPASPSADPFDEISIEDWRWAVDINLWGVIYGCQAAVPKMKRARPRLHPQRRIGGWPLGSTPGDVRVQRHQGGGRVVERNAFCRVQDPKAFSVAVLCPTFFRTNIVGAQAAAPPRDKDDARVIRWMERSKVQAPDVAKAADRLGARRQALRPADARWGGWHGASNAPRRSGSTSRWAGLTRSFSEGRSKH